MLWVFVFVLCGLTASFIAAQKGKKLVSWLAIGLLLGPIALFAAMLAAGSPVQRLGIMSCRLRICQNCAGLIRSESSTCTRCGQSLVVSPESREGGPRKAARLA